MRQELKDDLNALFNICDHIDSLSIGIKKQTDGKFTTRTILHTDLLKYMLYLTASDGEVSIREAECINYYLDMDWTTSRCLNYIKDREIYSTSFEQTIPWSLEVFVDTDNIQAENGIESSIELGDWAYKMYLDLGVELLLSDGNATPEEKDDLNIYLAMIHQYIEQNSIRKSQSIKTGLTKKDNNSYEDLSSSPLLKDKYYLCSPPKFQKDLLSLQEEIEFHQKTSRDGYYIRKGNKTEYTIKDTLLIGLDGNPLMQIDGEFIYDVKVPYSNTYIPKEIDMNWPLEDEDGNTNMMFRKDGTVRYVGKYLDEEMNGVFRKDGDIIKITSYNKYDMVSICYYGVYDNKMCKYTYCSEEIFTQTYGEELTEVQKIIQKNNEEVRNSRARQTQKVAPWATQYYDYPCKYCGAYKVRPAKWDDKSLSIAFWGIASDKIGKYYKCENCGKMW